MERKCALVGVLLGLVACSRDPRGADFARCESGRAEACERLAERFARGEGVPLDELAALAFRSRACSLGGAKACTFPGADERALLRALETGQPLPTEGWQPFPEAPELIIRRPVASLGPEAVAEIVRLRGDCAGGKQDACVDAARLSVNASEFAFANPIELVPMDLSRAARLLTAPCRAGHARACGLRAWALGDVKTMRHSCELGWGPACAVAAGWTAEGKTRASLAERACAAGASLGCGASSARGPMLKECEGGDVMACAGLSAESSDAPLKRACQHGKPTACLERLNDDDVAPTQVEARLWQACGAGHLRGCHALVGHLAKTKPEQGRRLSLLVTARGYRYVNSFRLKDGGPVSPPVPTDVLCGGEGCALPARKTTEDDLREDAHSCAYSGMGARPYQLFPQTDSCARVLSDLRPLRPASEVLVHRLAHRACRPQWAGFWPCLIAGARDWGAGP